jgi:hypothetical protein
MKAVITGDIIHSTKMPDKYRQDLLLGLDNAMGSWKADYKFKYEIYRGDSIQCLFHQSKYALRVALMIKSYIKSAPLMFPDLFERGDGKSSKYEYERFYQYRMKTAGFMRPLFSDCKLSVGIGTIEKESTKLALSSGEAFILSGRALDDYKNKQTFGVHTKDKYAQELITESTLLDFILSKATPSQSEVVLWKLLEHTEPDIAANININQSAVNQRSNAAGWNAINTMVQRFETIYAHE